MTLTSGKTGLRRKKLIITVNMMTLVLLIMVMSKKELLINEIEQVPESFLDEVLDFVHFLKTKIIKERLDTAIASESSLKKDWLKPEEDEAWQNL
jgi:hypothetical protein